MHHTSESLEYNTGGQLTPLFCRLAQSSLLDFDDVPNGCTIPGNSRRMARSPKYKNGILKIPF